MKYAYTQQSVQQLESQSDSSCSKENLVYVLSRENSTAAIITELYAFQDGVYCWSIFLGTTDGVSTAHSPTRAAALP